MRVVIVGGAACVWQDLAAAEKLVDFDIVIAVNDAGAAFPGIVDYWVTLHPEHFPAWLKARADRGYAPPLHTVAHEGHSGIGRRNGIATSMLWPYTWPGSSGLFAVEFALKFLEARKIVLCGVPMDKRQHFPGALMHPDPNRVWIGADGFWTAWQPAVEHMKDRVRSMSGRTRDLLGEPTRQWLA